MLIHCLLAPLAFALIAASNPPSLRTGERQKTSQSYPPEKHKNRNSHQGQSTGPVFVLNIESPHQDAIASDFQGDGKWYYRPDWWVAMGTVALFVATTGLWIFTGFMWWETRRISGDGRRQFHDEHRPWLGIEGEKLAADVQFYVPLTNVSITFTIRNTGKIPATNVIFTTDVVRIDEHARVSGLIDVNKGIAAAQLLAHRSDQRLAGKMILPGETPEHANFVIRNAVVPYIPSNAPMAEFQYILILVCSYCSPVSNDMRFSTCTFRLESRNGYIAITEQNTAVGGRIDASTFSFNRWHIGWSAE